MANTTETAKVFNCPNYAGTLYSATPTQTPFLTLIGGIGGSKALKTTNFKFPTCSLYEHPDASQPAISEDASLTAPTPYTYVRTQEENITQIFHETISVSYDKMANGGRLSGINTAGTSNNVPSELDFQTARTLEKIARDIEYTFLNGIYQDSSASNTARKTRGMLAAAGTQLDAKTAALSKQMIDDIMREAWSANAQFNDFYLFMNGTQKQRLSAIYSSITGFALPATRTESGVNITTIETDFGVVKIVLDRFMPDSAILGADLSVIAPVEQETPSKGNFFREALSKKGAAEEYQIFGEIGLDHGPSFMHFAITNLETASTDSDDSGEGTDDETGLE